MFRKKKAELSRPDTFYDIKNLETLMNVQHQCYENMRKIKELKREMGVLKGEMVKHRKCEVCRILGHEPEMTLVERPSLSGWHDWIHNSCLCGSEYERRKGAPDAEMDKDKDLRGAGQEKA